MPDEGLNSQHGVLLRPCWLPVSCASNWSFEVLVRAKTNRAEAWARFIPFQVVVANLRGRVGLVLCIVWIILLLYADSVEKLLIGLLAELEYLADGQLFGCDDPLLPCRSGHRPDDIVLTMLLARFEGRTNPSSSANVPSSRDTSHSQSIKSISRPSPD